MARTVRSCALLIAAVSVSLAAAEILALTDITPDAVTMATTRNPWTGEVAWLTDGRTPDGDPEAPAVRWEWIGLLAVSWPEPVRLAKIRVYLGELGRYRVFGYMGGSFDQDGERVGVETAVYGRQDLVPAGSTGWCDISFPQEPPVDNISFQVIGGAVVYEMQFLAADGRAVAPGAVREGRSCLLDPIRFLFGSAARFLSHYLPQVF